jgi:Domain of unknown function (DUF4129)
VIGLTGLLQAIPADSIRRAVRDVFSQPAYDWVQVPHGHWLRDLWYRFRDWLDRFSTQHPLGARLLFWAALLVLLGLLVHLGLTVWRIYRATVERPGAVAAPLGAAPGDARAYLQRAEALARAGRFSEALAFRFLALLLELDRVEAVKFHPSKTPAEYVHEARLGAAGRATLAGLVSRLYHHVFGAEPLDERGYREFGAAAGAVLHAVSR